MIRTIGTDAWTRYSAPAESLRNQIALGPGWVRSGWPGYWPKCCPQKSQWDDTELLDTVTYNPGVQICVMLAADAPPWVTGLEQWRDWAVEWAKHTIKASTIDALELWNEPHPHTDSPFKFPQSEKGFRDHAEFMLSVWRAVKPVIGKKRELWGPAFATVNTRPCMDYIFESGEANTLLNRVTWHDYQLDEMGGLISPIAGNPQFPPLPTMIRWVRSLTQLPIVVTELGIGDNAPIGWVEYSARTYKAAGAIVIGHQFSDGVSNSTQQCWDGDVMRPKLKTFLENFK